MSHSSRSAWIEMIAHKNIITNKLGRTLHGVRGLKFVCGLRNHMMMGRTLHGVRGLK